MWKALRKPLTEQDREAARQSMTGLNEALAERFGRLPDVRVIPWIGDLHLHDEADYARLSPFYAEHVDTGRQFLLAMEELQALRPSAPLLVAGGDMTDYGRPGEWRRFRRLLDESGWTKPVVPAFGNHDNKNQSHDPAAAESLRSIWNEIRRADWPEVSDPGELFYRVRHDGLNYIVIDTMRNNEYRISQRQRDWLLGELARLDAPALVVCHRHFLNVGNWVDEGLAVRDKELWELLDASPFVLGVFSGHVHYARLWEYRSKLYATFPSTAHGIGVGAGWGGIVMRDKRIAAVFYKELGGEGYEYYNGPRRQEGSFVFMTPEDFENHRLCDPRYWPRTSSRSKTNTFSSVARPFGAN